MSYAIARRRGTNGEINKLYQEDRAVHDWYRFVLSFPPHLVREYLQRFKVGSDQMVLDPFCGAGTVLVECKKQGIAAVGVESHPMAHFASEVKVDWTPDPNGLLEHAREIAQAASDELERQGIPDETLNDIGQNEDLVFWTLPPEKAKLLLKNSISPRPLHKALVLLDCLERDQDKRYARHERLALAKTLVSSSNLHFGPEVGIGPIKSDAPVISPWLANVRGISDDLREVRDLCDASTVVHRADARQIRQVLEPNTIDAVITSPPYPNEKDYTRTTRLETVLLGFIADRADLQELKRDLIRSNTRNVFKSDDDDSWVATHPEVRRLADSIEARREELGKTSGFEGLYARVTKLYFGGLMRHLSDLRPVLRPGAHLAYVVGDQASFLRVMIRTGQLLTDIAHSLGYELVGTDLFRTRWASATSAHLREEVVVLRWPGGP